MNLTKLLSCLSVLLKLTQTLRLLKKCLTAATLLLLCGGTAMLLWQKAGGKKACKRTLKRVIG